MPLMLKYESEIFTMERLSPVGVEREVVVMMRA